MLTKTVTQQIIGCTVIMLIALEGLVIKYLSNEDNSRAVNIVQKIRGMKGFKENTKLEDQMVK